MPGIGRRRCAAQLAALGVGPDAVSHIVQTHLHIDHTGALGHFPEATVVVLPARSGPAAAGGFGTTGRAGCAPVEAAAAAVAASDAPAGAGLTCGVAAGFAPVGGALGIGGFVSSAISSFLIDDWGLTIDD